MQINLLIGYEPERRIYIMYYYMEFENERDGIRIFAESEKQAVEIAENPKNWRDGKERKVCYIDHD